MSMAPIVDRTIRVGELDLHYLEAGSGPPVLLLHGWPTNAQLWRQALPLIGESRRAIALDLPGFGGSAKPLDASYSFRYFDQVITDFLAALDIDEVGLVVHDLGGPIGLHWAAGQQARVTDLVLLNTLVFPEMSWAVTGFVAASWTPGLRSLLTSQAGLAAAMRFGVTNKARITPAVAALYQRPFVERDARRALLATVHGLHPRGFKTITAALPGFDVPLALIYGEDDRILPRVANTMQRVQALLPHAQLTAIADCGHFLQEDRPDEVAGLLADFLAESCLAAA
jgi:haloalkane dehalogenase